LPCPTPGERGLTAPLIVTSTFTDQEWDDLVSRHPDGTVEHRAAWRQIFATVFRQDPVYLMARRGAEPVGVLPLVRLKSAIFGRSMVSLPYTSYGGLLTSDLEAAGALIEHARVLAGRFGAGHLELRNSAPHCDGGSVQTHKVGARLRLPGSPEHLWTMLDKKVRNLVRKGQKEALTVHQGGAELLDDFYSVFSENMRDLGTPVFPRSLFTHVLNTFDSTTVFVVRQGTRAVAGSILLRWRKTAYVPWASALRRFRHLSPNMLLYWSMLEAAVNHGDEVFDFGRSTRDGGTHHFKQQWGAADFPLYWERVSVNGSGASTTAGAGASRQFLVDAWTRLPLPVANWLGPRLIRHVA
jgi:FemAB-related protein (PEP-CTERM system-associated)